MELCTSRAISNLPSRANSHRSLCVNAVNLISRTSLIVNRSPVSGRNHSRVLHCMSSVPRETIPEETSNGVDEYGGGKPDAAISVEAVSSVDKNITNESVSDGAQKTEASVDEPTQALEFLDSIKLDSENTYSILLYGGGAVLFLWLASAVVGAVDSIPLFPKLMELVGLGYTLWFTTRYLVFKQNREELASEIEGIKKQVLGSDDD